MKKAAFLVLCAMGASSALAQGTTVGPAGANATTGPTPSAQEFVQKAAMSDLFEIQSSKLALDKGNDQAKSFAKQMITDHQKTSSELKGLMKADGIKEPPSRLDSPHQATIETLKAQNGKDFSKAYYDSQQTAHKEAVSLFERYSRDGDDPKLKEWAGKTLPTLQHHQEMADALGR